MDSFAQEIYSLVGHSVAHPGARRLLAVTGHSLKRNGDVGLRSIGTSQAFPISAGELRCGVFRTFKNESHFSSV